MDRITLVVNSCKTYSTIALPKLLESLNKYNPGFKVVVVIGGCSTPTPPVVMGNYTIVETRNNSIDLTGFIGLIEEDIKLTPLFFYIHDTTEVGPGFFPALERYSVLPDGVTSASFQFPSCYIGIYSTSLLDKFKNEIFSLKNMDESSTTLRKLKDLLIDQEDKLFKLNIQNHAFFPTKPIPNWGTTDDIYKCGIQRLREYYPDFDFTKFKGSWAKRADLSYPITP